jgi:cytochrome c oxidase subunit II
MRALRRFALVALVLALTACSTPQTIFNPKGTNAEKINNLQVPVFIAAGVVGVIVAVMLIFVMVTGRRRRREVDDDPRQIHGNTRVEIGWTIVPFLILLIVAIFTVGTLISIDRQPANAMKISVYGQQWWWSYQYDVNGDGIPDVVTPNELVIPVGQPITLEVQSRDVIHSFWIPALNGTRDAVPGRVQTLQIVADKPGVYQGQCKEFCGLSHANMRARAIAMEPNDFQQWLRDQQTGPPTPAAGSQAAAGLELFKSKCAQCHQINTVNDVEGHAALVSRYAPNLTHLMSRTVFASGMFPLYVTDANGNQVFNRNQLEAWLRDPPALLPMAPAEGRGMPNLQLSENDIDRLVDYLQTLGPYPQGVTPPTSSP